MPDQTHPDPQARLDARTAEAKAVAARARTRIERSYAAILRGARILAESQASMRSLERVVRAAQGHRRQSPGPPAEERTSPRD